MPYNASSDLWYQYFTADGLQIWILIAVFGARSALAMLGIGFNMGLICITIKNKSLQGICGILLAIDSFFSTTMDITFLISFFVVISGVRFVRYQYCFPIIIVPGSLFGNCAQLTMVFTGLDRLSSVIFPIWYKMRNKTWTIAVVCLMLLCYATYQFIIYYMAYEINMDMMVSCSTTEMTSGSMGALMNANGYTLSAILMTLYALIWLLTFKLNSTLKRVDQANRRLAKSLMLIIGLNLVGVFVKSFFLFLFQFVPINVFVSKGYAVIIAKRGDNHCPMKNNDL